MMSRLQPTIGPGRVRPRPRWRGAWFALALLCLFAWVSCSTAQITVLSGEPRRWHKLTITLTGPFAAEDGTPNPFTDYRMTVTFSNTVSGLTCQVPGYFAADGDAANTSATAGNQWRAHLAPDHTGLWTYRVSFRAGPGVAVNPDPQAGVALAPYDGVAGSFSVGPSNKGGRDLRGKGRLDYVGRHHLRFADGSYFLKAGADSPENFLAYDQFDNTPDNNGYRKNWAPHVADWNPGDPQWQGGKGRGILGALNYLSAKGCNSQSFLTYSHNGDDDNVFPYVDPADRLRLDCSKLDQWEIVFAHADRMGMHLTFKTQEQENDQDMDGGELGPERRLYYRELIARFGHHLALTWNLGEENSNTDAQRKAFAQFFYDTDPYHHHLVLHTFLDEWDAVYGPLLGAASRFTGVGLQVGANGVFNETFKWVANSAAAGRPWVVTDDEQGPAGSGIDCDSADPTHYLMRRWVLWGNLMAGGAGIESYYGYGTCETDLTAQNHRTRDNWYSQCAHALGFFHNHAVPFWDMANDDDLVSGVQAKRCLRKPGEVYVLYLADGGSPSLNLTGAPGAFEVRWYDPFRGGALQYGSTALVTGGGVVPLGGPPSSPASDWVVLVRAVGALHVDAGPDAVAARAPGAAVVNLTGTVLSANGPATVAWSQTGGPAGAAFQNATSPVTTATLTGGAGVYEFRLTAAAGTNQASDTVALLLSQPVTNRYAASEDVYVENETVVYDEGSLNIGPNNPQYVACLLFSVTNLPADTVVTRAYLCLWQQGDALDQGTLRFFRGSSTDWEQATVTAGDAPLPLDQVGSFTGGISRDQLIEVDVTPLVTGNGRCCLVVTMDSGGDAVQFGSAESAWQPQLLVVAERPLLHLMRPAAGGVRAFWLPENWLLETATDLARGDWRIQTNAPQPFVLPTTVGDKAFLRTRSAAP